MTLKYTKKDDLYKPLLYAAQAINTDSSRHISPVLQAISVMNIQGKKSIVGSDGPRCHWSECPGDSLDFGLYDVKKADFRKVVISKRADDGLTYLNMDEYVSLAKLETYKNVIRFVIGSKSDNSYKWHMASVLIAKFAIVQGVGLNCRYIHDILACFSYKVKPYNIALNRSETDKHAPAYLSVYQYPLKFEAMILPIKMGEPNEAWRQF